MRGHRIKQRREDLGMTQQELADKLLVTVQPVGKREDPAGLGPHPAVGEAAEDDCG